MADLSPDSPLLKGLDVRDQKTFQQILEDKMGSDHSWGFAPYLEDRATLLADCPQMVAEKRFIHLGLDIIVHWELRCTRRWMPRSTNSGYESGEGNYGGNVLLKHESPKFQTFYSLYGHLCKDPPARQSAANLPPGEAFAEIGDFHENGNWFYHTHLQMITQKGLDQGYLSKGYCAESDLKEMNALCPSPIPLFKRG